MIQEQTNCKLQTAICTRKPAVTNTNLILRDIDGLNVSDFGTDRLVVVEHGWEQHVAVDRVIVVCLYVDSE